VAEDTNLASHASVRSMTLCNSNCYGEEHTCQPLFTTNATKDFLSRHFITRLAFFGGVLLQHKNYAGTCALHIG